jgi:hypothetical protein
MLRHASIGDTLLASALVGRPHGIFWLRYVLKRELLWDPCLDVVGNRLPHVFVDRASDRFAARDRACAGARARSRRARWRADLLGGHALLACQARARARSSGARGRLRRIGEGSTRRDVHRGWIFLPSTRPRLRLDGFLAP